MGKAFEVLNGTALNPGVGPAAVVPNAGDTFTVRSANFGAPIELIEAWAFTTTNLLMRLRSPRMHDQAQNMRLQPVASQSYPLISWFGSEPLYPQDPITVELSGGATETDLAAVCLYYSDLPGISARLHMPAEVEPLIQHITTVEVDIVATANGVYGATTALNGTFDTLIRNRDYAILGYECAVNGGSLGIRGADTGNLRVGGPLINIPYITSNWFARLSEENNLPCIPVINSANVAGVLLDATAQAGATYKVGVNLALLSDPGLPG